MRVISGETVYERTHRVLMVLDRRRTVREISEMTGLEYRMVYRCIARLISLGFDVRNDLRHYWVEEG